jgi:two-component system sensor kinase FixL
MPRLRQPARAATVLLQASALVLAIAVLDWLVSDAVPLGWLYLAPMALAATVLPRALLLVLACGCTLLAECFDGYPWDWLSGIPRDLLYMSAFAGSALFVHITMHTRRAASANLLILQEQMAARQDAEEQLRVLVENSPVAVFTADAAGTVLLANEAANALFAIDAETPAQSTEPAEASQPAGPGGPAAPASPAAARPTLAGRSFAPFLPPLLELPTLQAPTPGGRVFRTAMQCRGHRANGEIFQADVWFSTYGTSTGPRLAVFVADSSEDLRDREEASLHQLLTGSRILVGAVSHEVRNVCAAIAVVHENLRRSGALAAASPGNAKDFEALGTLILALERIASVELREATHQLAAIDLHSLLEEVQIVIGSALREEEITLLWDIPRQLPPVWADRQSLFQVLLNLVKNSQHALETPGLPTRAIHLTVQLEPTRICLTIADTGPGVPYPEFLFKPFQQQARAAGLGLYLSRALMRSFAGDLHYIPAAAGSPPGATFVVELATSPRDTVSSPNTRPDPLPSTPAAPSAPSAPSAELPA